MKKTRLNDRTALALAFAIFMMSVIFVVIFNSFVMKEGFHVEYSISKYVGLNLFTAGLFLACNVMVGWLLYQYLLSVKRNYKMSQAWWVCGVFMLVMLVGLSLCPVEYFDRFVTEGEHSIVTYIHFFTSRAMFFAAILTGIETLIRFWKINRAKWPALIFVVYGFFAAFCFLSKNEFFFAYELIFEWLFLALYMGLLAGIPDKK